MRYPAIASIVIILAMSGCERPPAVIGLDNPTTPVASVQDLSRHRMFLITTRTASSFPGEFFSSERAPDISLASVEVTIPPNHQTGVLERPDEIPPNPLTEFTVVDPAVYGSDAAFIAEIDRALALLPPQDRRLLLYVHGYNNTTSEAILRFGQFVEDTDFRGVPVLFTWASAARAPRYVYDLNSALAARGRLKDMADLLRQTDAAGVDIFAHSMGAFLTMEGLVDAQLAGRLDQGGVIETIMLASPDIDMDVFRTQIAVLPQSIREKIYLLISADDQALRMSRTIAGGVPRVGAADAAELEALGLTVIDLSSIEDSSAGSHAKFAGSPEVVQLIGEGLNMSARFGESPAPEILDILANAPIRIVGN